MSLLINNIASASALSVLIPVGAGFINVRHLDSPLKIALGFFFITLLFEACGAYYFSLGLNNMPFFHLHTVLEFALLGMVFHQAYSIDWAKKLIPWLIALFTVFAAVYAWNYGIKTFNAVPRSVENLIMIGFAVLYMAQLNRDLPVKRLETFPMFWIATAILLYFSGTLLLFSLGQILEDLASRYPVDIWITHSFLNIIFNTLCGIGLWASRNKSASRFSSLARLH